MEITPEQKALLQQVDTDIEASFVGGVTQGGDFLPALPLYDRIKPEDRQTGRQGILSTFAGFLARLASFQPTVIPLAFENGYGSWNEYTGAFGNPTPFAEFGCHKNLVGEVVLEGLLATPTATPLARIGVTPVGYRSAKTRLLPGLLNGVAVDVWVDAGGGIYCGAAVTSGQWLSLDGIRFRPA